MAKKLSNWEIHGVKENGLVTGPTIGSKTISQDSLISMQVGIVFDPIWPLMTFFNEIFPEQQEKLGLIDTDGKGDDDLDDDGSFWMAWDDFCEEFEQLTVCHLDDPDDMEKRCIGTFSYNGMLFISYE